MSKATKRKHVLKEIEDDDYGPPTGQQEIVKILNSRGNNLHEVEDSTASKYLVSMPTKFRRNVWIKRGNYVVVEPIEEGDKVKAEIVRILTNTHIKYFKEDGIWPKAFCDQEKTTSLDDELFVNTNRQNVDLDEISSTSTDSE